MKRSMLIALIIFICFIQVSADTTGGKASIEINLPSRILSLYNEGILLKEYPVCIGKQSTPTPQGEYRVVYKTVDPYWINKEVVVPPGPKNPLGVRWIGLTKSLGVHGNNKPESIGTIASAGCIRMYNKDVEELYSLMPVNTPVTIKYDRIKVFEDIYSGEQAAIIYPDIYKKGVESITPLLENLSQAGFGEELIKKIRDTAKKSISKPLAVSQGTGVFLNNSLVTCDAFEEQGDIYINCNAGEDVLGLTAETAGALDIGIKELEGTIYINLTQTVKRFGGRLSYEKNSNNAYVDMKIVKVNGVFAGINLGDYDKVDLLPVESVKKLGYEYSEDKVDIRLFDKSVMKLLRKNVWSVNVGSIAETLGGCTDISSQYRIVDLRLPTYIRAGNEYFKTEYADGRLVLDMETAYKIRERTGWTVDAFAAQTDVAAEKIDLEVFLEDYDYTSNNFHTVIDINTKEN